MKNVDKSMGELLDLLKTHPELISALVFDPASVKGLLKSKAARRLVLGVDAKAFMRFVAASKDGGPVAACLQRTAAFCAGTILCLGGTRPCSRTWPYRAAKPTRAL
jgi:hypothetical protein